MVSAGDPLAASAALRELANGGNAVDAVLTASAVQSVVEMPWCGLGGDLFLMVFTPGDGVRTLNGSGSAPHASAILCAKVDGAPLSGRPPSPGTGYSAAAWEMAAKRYGTRPLAKLLEPAIHYARDGFPVYQRLAEALQRMHVARPDTGPGPELRGSSATPRGRLACAFTRSSLPRWRRSRATDRPRVPGGHRRAHGRAPSPNEAAR